MRILLFGGNGQVGHALQNCGPLADEVVVMTRWECDLMDSESIRTAVRRVRPDVIVNAAAYTAVDKAESDREVCFAVNAAAPAVMAEEAAAMDAKLLHYSTDYVFDGTKTSPYAEGDTTNPRNVYGASKLAGERAIAETDVEFLILRTSWVYSNHGENFLKTMLRLRTEHPNLRIVADQHGAPTSAEAIAEATARILHSDSDRAWKSGVCHMTAGGATTWYGFANAIFSRAGGVMPEVTPISTEEYPRPAVRPRNSVLSNDKFAEIFGFRLSHWQEQLDGVMNARTASVI